MEIDEAGPILAEVTALGTSRTRPLKLLIDGPTGGLKQTLNAGAKPTRLTKERERRWR